MNARSRLTIRLADSAPLCDRSTPQLPPRGFFGPQYQHCEQSLHALHGSAPTHGAAWTVAAAASHRVRSHFMGREYLPGAGFDNPGANE
jgi:hypothetical protein